MATDGLITMASRFAAKETMDRLETETKARGMTVFARIDHAAGAAAAGLPLRQTELLIFGNARGGTPLIQAEQTIGIDLPLKALVWRMQPARCGCPITTALASMAAWARRGGGANRRRDGRGRSTPLRKR